MKRKLLILATALSLAAAPPPPPPTATTPPPAPATHPIPMVPAKLSLTGTLQTAVMAIGGETTGILLTPPTGPSYELDIQNPDLKTKAQSLNGKTVTATGTLTLKQGIETGQRRILTVESLTPSSNTAPSTTQK